jgi:uncharacterized membrane protein YphA (DoxX/SURF4 family)
MNDKQTESGVKNQVANKLRAAPILRVVSRACLVSPYFVSGAVKALNFEEGLMEMRQFNLEPAAVILMSTIAIQLVASSLIIGGRMVMTAAGTLIVFTILATYVAHDFWSIDDTVARSHQANAFLANLGLAGGLAVLAGAVRKHGKERRRII